MSPSIFSISGSPNGWSRCARRFLNAVMAVALGFVAWRVWIIAGLTADYGDATEFLEIRLAPINYFIAALSACGAAAFVVNTVRHARAALSTAAAAKDAPDDRGTA